MAKLKDKKCIVCGAWVAWEGHLPCACAEHRYHEVFEAYDKARLTKRAADSSKAGAKSAIKRAPMSKVIRPAKSG